MSIYVYIVELWMILVYKYIHEIHEKVLVSHEKVLETTLYKNNHQHVNLKYQNK